MEDKDIIVGITREISSALDADRIIAHFAEDATWFHITDRYIRGYDNIYNEFKEQLSSLEFYEPSIVEMNCNVSGNLGVISSIHDILVRGKGHTSNMRLIVRNTDCYEKRNDEWKIVHKHTSLCLEDSVKLADAILKALVCPCR